MNRTNKANFLMISLTIAVLSGCGGGGGGSSGGGGGTPGIAGTVTDSAGAPLANIRIRVRDFNRWVTRAETDTDANGQFSLNVAAGDYIVGALNFTNTSTAASEWWTCNVDPAQPAQPCGDGNSFGAAKVAVVAGASLINFKLEPGARVQGTITDSALSPAPLPGTELTARDWAGGYPFASAEADASGLFRINLRPGEYTLAALNRTALPFASGLYNGVAGGGTSTGGGGRNRTEATKMVLIAGNIYTVNFALVEGGVVQGLVTDGTSPVTGSTVRFDDATGASVESTRTDVDGKYRLWLRPGITYTVRSRGQTATRLVAANSIAPNPAAVDFTAVVARGTATLHAPGGALLSKVKVRVYDTTANNDFQSQENSNGDGTVEVYAPSTGNYLIEYKLDNGSTTVGTAIHDGSAAPTQTRLLQGASVAFNSASPLPLGPITLPAGGELRGAISMGGAPSGNIVVQVRSVNVGGANRLTNARTLSDGSYSISVPAGTYSRVCAFLPGTSGACPSGTPVLANTYASADNVVVVANQSNTLDIAIP